MPILHFTPCTSEWCKTFCLIFSIFILFISTTNICSGQSKTSTKLKTETGCPFTFDFGNLGFQYERPALCTDMIPDFVPPGTKPLKRNDPNTPNITLTLAIYQGTTNTYELTIEINNHTNTQFRMWKAAIRVRAVGKHGKLLPGVGFFERIDDFQNLCCEASKKRTMIRFLNVKQLRPHILSVRWVPVKFSGLVVFAANIFNSPKEFVTVNSPVYKVPFSVLETVIEDEEWPENDPHIPDY